MVNVANQTEFDAAIVSQETQIDCAPGTYNVASVPTWSCTISIQAGAALTGAIVNSCAGQVGATAKIYFNGAVPPPIV